MDEFDAIGHGLKVDRRSTDWGILSLTIGASFLIMSPIMLTFNMLYWVQGVRNQTREEIEINRICTVVIGGFFLMLIAFGIFAAVRSLAVARAAKEPIALGLGGLLACGLDIILWIGLGLHLLLVLNTFA